MIKCRSYAGLLAGTSVVFGACSSQQGMPYVIGSISGIKDREVYAAITETCKHAEAGGGVHGPIQKLQCQTDEGPIEFVIERSRDELVVVSLSSHQDIRRASEILQRVLTRLSSR